MWGQGPPVVVDDSPPPEEGTQAVVANPGGVATDAGDGPQERTALRMEMDRLENETQHTLRGMTDAFSVELPFTVEDKRRIVENLNKIEEEYQEQCLHEPECPNFTRAVLIYMLKELHDVFGLRDRPDPRGLEEDSKAAAIENRTQEANADEEGLAGRKRQRSLPATRYRATRYATG